MYSVLAWLFPIAPTLIVTPIVIAELGNDLYGIYVIVLGFTGYFFTLHLGKAVTKYVAEYHATGEIDKIANTVSATLLFGFTVGTITTAFISIFASNFVREILEIPTDLQRTATIALYLGCLNILVSMLGLTFQYILQGLQRFDAFMWITNASSVLLTVGVVVAVLNGYGVIGMFAVSLAVSVISASVAAILVRSLLPELRFRFRVGKAAWSEVLRYGMSIMAYQLFGSILLLFERSWITKQFGPEALTFYVVPMTLAVFLQMFVSSLVLGIFPVINQHLANTDILAKLYKQSTKVIVIVVAFSFTSAVAGGHLFLGLWLSEEFATSSYHILVIQTVVFSIVSLGMVIWQIAEAFRFAWLTAVANFVWLATSIPLMIILSHPWQTVGVAYGRLIGCLVYIPLIIYVERRFLDGVFSSYWMSIGWKVMTSSILAGVTEYYFLGQLPRSWATLALSIGAGGFIYLFLLFLFRLIGTDERKFLGRALFGIR